MQNVAEAALKMAIFSPLIRFTKPRADIVIGAKSDKTPMLCAMGVAESAFHSLRQSEIGDVGKDPSEELECANVGIHESIQL